ncbi:MAG: hypothetical protein IJB70_03100 [Clostridia bacterium]|nr:hypothetical protein [Clostridia bacterium]
MHITTEFIPNQNNTHVICATSTYGKGLLTSVVHMFCEILGRDCEMYNKKIRNACNKALIELEERAKTKKQPA